MDADGHQRLEIVTIDQVAPGGGCTGLQTVSSR